MTANIINALANAETKRYNQAVERLRAAELSENARHNAAVEAENVRHNQRTELEAVRSNMANERLKSEGLSIDRTNALTNQRNATSNERNSYTNQRNATINAVNASTNRFSAQAAALNNATSTLVSAYNTNVRSQELREAERHNKAVEAETNRNNLVINSLKEKENQIALMRAKTEKWRVEKGYEVDQAYIQQGWARNIGDLVINGARISAAPQ